MAMYNEITVEAELTNTEYMITKNYNLLENKPQINSVELIGNKSLEDLGINPDAEENIIDTVKVNGAALTPDANKAVDVTITTGTNNGTVKVNGTDVNVKGLKSAAYTESSAYDVSGAAATVQGNVDALAVVVSGKVDKVQGKGLSTNDYTNEDKTKLEGIQAGAQVNTVTSVAGKTGAVTLNKSDVGLGNVNNTSDANKPVSNATQNALNLKVDKVTGKGLSTEDFTTTEKTKLAGISAEANKVEITPVVTEGTTLATISIDGVDTDIKGSDIEVDDEMSPTSENPVQNKVITATLEDKADKDGNYEDMAVGQLLSNTFEEDKAPYNFRTSGGTLEIGDREYDTLIGGTVAFNQLVNATISSTTVNGVTYTKNGDGTYTLTGTPTVTSCFLNLDYDNHTNNYLQVNHVYYLPKCNNHENIGLGLFGATIDYYSVTGSKIIKVSGLATGRSWVRVQISNLLNTDIGTVIFKPQLIDLTQMFGSTIADYIYSLEQATAGSGVAYFKSLFPKDYYDYNAGQLMSVKALSHKMVGFNQWDEEWELGSIDASGEPVPSAVSIRSKNFTQVIPNTDYFFKNYATKDHVICYYDSNKNFISRWVTNALKHTFSTPSNCHFIKIRVDDTTTYTSGICINLHWDGERDGEYEAYEEHIYPLDSDLELRGIPKLDSNNKLYYDGDTYESDGTVTRRYGFRAYQSGDESLADAITDGTNTVYKLTTPTTETADTFENPQLVSNLGTEEYTDSRTIQIPVGHITKYPPDLKAKLESAPDSPSVNGDYILRHNNGENSYVALTKELPTVPTTDGTYVLKATVSSGTATLSWVAE